MLAKTLPQKDPGETLDAWLRRIQELSNKVEVRQATDFLASRMVQWVNVRNARSWRAAAQQAQRGSFLHGLLRKEMQGAVGSRVRALTRENAAYISSIPRQAAIKLTDEVRKAQQAGARPETVARLMRKRFPELLKSRINLIARTETAKASTELTRARSEELGLDYYIWRTSHDVRVRDSHRKMDGVVVPCADPPAPELLVGERDEGHYHAGEIYNCRCTQIVVLTLDDIKFPARVYHNGKIEMMTRVRFKQVAINLESRSVA